MFFVKFDHSGRYLCAKPGDNSIIFYPGSFSSCIIFDDQNTANVFGNFFLYHTKNEKSFYIESIFLEDA